MQQPLAIPGTQGLGVNHMLEMFKMQYLMKFLDSSGGTPGARGGSSLVTMLVLLGYDQLVKYIPGFIQIIWLWVTYKIYGKVSENDKKEPLLLPTTQTPPPTKTIKAFIQFERHPEKAADPRIDAVIHHVCNLPDVRSLRYNGVEMIPNFKDILMIENDIWFEIINPSSGIMSIGSSSKPSGQEAILYRLSTYDHDITWLHKFVDQTIDRYEQEKKNRLGSETYYFDQLIGTNETYRNPYGSKITMFTKSKFTSNRTLNNVYLRQIGELRQRVEFFMRRRDWYDSKGIPHTLGIVMYGVPGCGKTSTIKGIANETKRHIFNISLSEIKTKETLKDLFYNEQVHILHDGKTDVLTIPLKHRLYVIEDIDAMESVVLKRSVQDKKRDEEKKLKMEAEMEILKETQGETIAKRMMQGKKDEDRDKLDLATLLNVLDGVRETPGRIIVLSTNYPERLDEALLRPGRFDMMLEFEKHSCKVLQQHIEQHYDIKLTEKQLVQIFKPELEKKWTPAEVSQILFRRIGDVDGAIYDLVYEDPAKLFKFSQLKTENSEVKVENSAEDKKTVENTEIKAENFSGTNLENLLETGNTDEEAGNTVEESGNTVNTEIITLTGSIIPTIFRDTSNKEDDINETNSEYSWGADHFMGGTTLYPDPPTQEQIEAEKVAHAALFKDQAEIETKMAEYDIEFKRREDEIYGPNLNDQNPLHRLIGTNLSDEQKKKIYELTNERNRKKEELERNMMLSSPMFTNNDGFTAINDFGLPSYCPLEGNCVRYMYNSNHDKDDLTSEILDKINFAAPDEGAETTLDDFFPEPLADPTQNFIPAFPNKASSSSEI
jgi:hypothetical protein